MSLFLRNGVDRVQLSYRTSFEFLGERMIDKSGPRLAFVVLQSGIEEGLKGKG
jgi:hypothetical protein